MGLKGSKTEQNLKDAFAGESQANRRYLYFANKADIEGQNDVAALFRSTAEGETGHAHGHLEFLEAVGDPATGLPIGSSRQNLKAAVAGETHEYTDMYPGMAKQARDEGFGEFADWFETLAKARLVPARSCLHRPTRMASSPGYRSLCRPSTRSTKRRRCARCWTRRSACTRTPGGPNSRPADSDGARTTRAARPRSKTTRAAQARSRSSRPATSTTTNPASATT